MTGSLHQAWTGGQYSLLLMTAASMLALHFLERAGAATSLAATLGALALSAAAVLLAAGRWDRTAAVALGAGLLLAGSDGSLLGRVGVWYALAWLAAHLFLPPAPYGSLDAVARTDPRGDWRMPMWAPAAAWALFVAHHAAVAVAALAGGYGPTALVSMLLAGLALVPSLRAPVWAVSLGIEVASTALGEGSGGVWLLHVLAVQPAWFPPRENAGIETVFYDGTCALCHGAARFLLSEDTDPARFRLAPLGGDAFEARLRAADRTDLPDSVVAASADGSVRTRSEAALYILDRIGGLWRIPAAVLSLVPLAALDAAYDLIARNRYQWFGRKTQACPILSGELRARFDT